MSTRHRPISTRSLSGYWSGMKPGFPGLRVIELTGASTIYATLPPVSKGGLLLIANLSTATGYVRPSSDAPLLDRDTFEVDGSNDVAVASYSWLLLAALDDLSKWVPLNLSTEVT